MIFSYFVVFLTELSWKSVAGVVVSTPQECAGGGVARVHGNVFCCETLYPEASWLRHSSQSHLREGAEFFEGPVSSVFSVRAIRAASAPGPRVTYPLYSLQEWNC